MLASSLIFLAKPRRLGTNRRKKGADERNRQRVRNDAQTGKTLWKKITHLYSNKIVGGVGLRNEAEEGWDKTRDQRTGRDYLLQFPYYQTPRESNLDSRIKEWRSENQRFGV